MHIETSTFGLGVTGAEKPLEIRHERYHGAERGVKPEKYNL